MTDSEKSIILKRIQKIPEDLLIVLMALFITLVLVFIPGFRETTLRIIIGVLFVITVPGYVLVAALFPETGNESRTTERKRMPIQSTTDTPSSGLDIDAIERVGLSFGMSIVVVSLVGLILDYTPWGIQLVPVTVVLSGFTLSLTVIAVHRRYKLPQQNRFSVSVRDWITSGKQSLLEPNTRTDVALNMFLIFSVFLAAVSIGYAITDPTESKSSTEFYLLTESEDEELVAEGYPTEFTQGQPESLVLGIENKERQAQQYTVIILLQEVETNDDSSEVATERVVGQFQTTVDHNEAQQHHHSITPTISGDQLRLTYLLYKDNPPANPTSENAYRDLYLWIDVEESER